MKLILHKSVEKRLKKLQEESSKDYLLVSNGLDDLECSGFSSSNIKAVKNSKKVFRKRVGKWRILFTEDGFVLRIWIVYRKKGPRDYDKWLNFIAQNI